MRSTAKATWKTICKNKQPNIRKPTIMTINSIKHCALGLIAGCGIAAALTACSDTWDDHYEAEATGVNQGSLWQAIKSNEQLSNFARVVEACGYDKALASSQVFTVFAPTNDCLSADEAEALIGQYAEEKGHVSDDDNTVIKEFLQNHMALYNYSVSSVSHDSIVLMNGKYAVITPQHISGTPLLTTNALYQNGVLFTVGQKVDYFANLFEYLRKDADLDSLRNFLYCGDTLNSSRAYPLFYFKEFEPHLSVAGGIVDGKTVYLDSVFSQQNELFDFLNAELNAEDSTYWMVAPTNKVWRQLVDEYASYFNYDNTVADRDSIAYTNTRLAITQGTVFSHTVNPSLGTGQPADSVMSTSAVLNYNLRRYRWGADSLSYYQYFNPTAPEGVFSGTQDVPCSNGLLMKADNWHIDKRHTFLRQIIIEAESQGSIKEVSRVEATQGDSIATVTPMLRSVSSDNAFYNQVSGNGFVEFVPAITTMNHTVTFNIRNVLSNTGYDIYLVTAPALANDSNASQVQRLPTNLRCTISYHRQNGTTESNQLVSMVTTNPDVVDHILLAEDFHFPVASYNLSEENPQVTLRVETRVSNAQQRNNTHTRTMRIDCIILKPHQ